MKFEFTQEEVSVIADSLAVQPWHKVQGLMGKILTAMQEAQKPQAPQAELFDVPPPLPGA